MSKNKNKTYEKSLLLNLTKTQYDSLRKISEINDISITAIIRLAITRFLKRIDKEGFTDEGY